MMHYKVEGIYLQIQKVFIPLKSINTKLKSCYWCQNQVDNLEQSLKHKIGPIFCKCASTLISNSFSSLSPYWSSSCLSLNYSSSNKWSEPEGDNCPHFLAFHATFIIFSSSSFAGAIASSSIFVQISRLWVGLFVFFFCCYTHFLIGMLCCGEGNFWFYVGENSAFLDIIEENEELENMFA